MDCHIAHSGSSQWRHCEHVVRGNPYNDKITEKLYTPNKRGYNYVCKNNTSQKRRTR